MHSRQRQKCRFRGNMEKLLSLKFLKTFKIFNKLSIYDHACFFLFFLRFKLSEKSPTLPNYSQLATKVTQSIKLNLFRFVLGAVAIFHSRCTKLSYAFSTQIQNERLRPWSTLSIASFFLLFSFPLLTWNWKMCELYFHVDVDFKISIVIFKYIKNIRSSVLLDNIIKMRIENWIIAFWAHNDLVFV